jgi:hypothetical protein
MTEEILGKDLAACQALAKEAASDDVIVEELKGKLLARAWRVRGNVLSDEYGPMMIAQEAHAVQRDLRAAAEALLAELGEVA